MFVGYQGPSVKSKRSFVGYQEPSVNSKQPSLVNKHSFVGHQQPSVESKQPLFVTNNLLSEANNSLFITNNLLFANKKHRFYRKLQAKHIKYLCNKAPNDRGNRANHTCNLFIYRMFLKNSRNECQRSVVSHNKGYPPKFMQKSFAKKQDTV
ncbi:MAG: hypothetical protein D3909_01355 [Candidatus Electrothrix sp. ATG1]|nr:hypothetical protein [Candidatus Electrothrix sp. ATG1]